DFAKAPLSSYGPSEEIRKLEGHIQNTKDRIALDEKKIKTYDMDRDDIKFARDYYKMRSDKYDTISKIQLTDNAYFIEGYVPSKYASDLVKKIEASTKAYVELTDPTEEDDVPVCLQNGFFADPMETVVDSYSLPSRTEFDPSKILSLFYYIFFGMMLSDAGYGLLIVIGTAVVLLKAKNMKPDSKKLIKLFFYSGISTVVWGVLFGSFFGDSVDIIAHVFFKVPAEQQVLVPFLKSLHVYWFEPVREPMRLLVFAFILGIIHLFTGLFLKFYILVKQGLIKDAIYDVVSWFMFVAGGICCLLGMDMVTNMLGLSFTLPKNVTTIAGIVTALGALIVVLTGGRESKNWFKRLLKGAYAAYGVTGWLSDILSYSRILALGLATGVIAQVFNKMGSMVQIPFVGAIIFILVFVVGHVLNLGINILGAYVHTNRLQFVEFFGKFYEGGGKKYTPFTEDTKFFHVKEEK
ncbi:MAG: V-type ATP synthase subunit I, partial [Lachnospiraceae bacterium]|nr:V-type ATP synthase subunit I [Lachnospiraceae bacterium]